MHREEFIKIKNKKFQIGVEVFVFEEDDQFIAYSPSLDISSYGNTQQEAGDAFEEATGIFLIYARKKGTLVADLLKLGWTVTQKPKAIFIAPDLEDTVKDNAVLQSLIASGQYLRTQTTMAIAS